MEKRIKIFKSFEEQEQFYIDKMLKSTPLQRFQNLFRMQQLTRLFHPPTNKERKIIIQKNGYTQ
jgi:hypothetical protein